jgi:hypothetical protein
MLYMEYHSHIVKIFNFKNVIIFYVTYKIEAICLK